MPDNPTFPCITFETSFGAQVESFTGYSGLANPIISVHCWANTAKAAQELALAVRDALVGQEWHYQGRHIQNVLEWSTTELFEPDVEVFHVSASMRVWYT